MTCGLNLTAAGSCGPIEIERLSGEGGALLALLFTELLLRLSGITGTLSAAGRGEDGVGVVALLLRYSAFKGYKRCMNSSAARGAL